MSGAKHGITDRNKKQRTGIPAWRPICTQSSPSQGSIAKEVKVVHIVNSNEAVDCKVSAVGQNFSEENIPTSVQGQVSVENEHNLVPGLQVDFATGADRHSISIQA